MADRSPTAFDVTLCVEELRSALALHDIALPSLRSNLSGFAGTYAPSAGLVALGNCTPATASALAAALRQTAGRAMTPRAEPFDLSLLAIPKAVPELRRHLRDHDFDVRLCATELLTNVIDHLGEGTPVTVRVMRTGHGRTRIEVTDPDPRALPVLLQASAAHESGRGLALVGALAERWGVVPEADRKTVWCELVTGPGQTDGPPEAPASDGPLGTGYRSTRLPTAHLPK
ncbi:ATP-binding protein [Streptomyces sp. NPDC048045]|uniref:ATP-binding protein n=1 Tax=Streptomyces sp. NPDC048045 TaxID=3154710 RepID=UPI00343B0628